MYFFYRTVVKISNSRRATRRFFFFIKPVNVHVRIVFDDPGDPLTDFALHNYIWTLGGAGTFEQ